MRLDEFKTQVLLLHSEQSTLDSLSSGFGDSYTVHCATSGSEALNTLVETPINVIVTAQNLPGMSGLEALREARKRSPDTIGILLAEDEDKGLEALVGDKEVFQVVRGNITGDSISKLVDNATQQVRLMALAKSANDSAANYDEPAEHIVMETSENGSTIISDGTGRLPVLDPKKVSAATALGSHSVDLLVLTKDSEFLETIKESSRGTHAVHYANTLAQADDFIRKHKVGVAVVDAAMVGEKIEQLTAHLRKGSPRLVSIVAGRRDDGEMMMDLINRGKVYRFLLKPVSPGRARLAVEASVKHHLEAPDAAFKARGPAQSNAAAAKPQAVAPVKPATKPARPATPASIGKDAAKPTSDDERKKAPASTQKADPPLGSGGLPTGESPNDDALSSAFGESDSSFTETVTGLFATVSKKFRDDEDSGSSAKLETKQQQTAPENDSATEAASSGGAAFRDPRVLGGAAAVIVVLVGALFWFMSGSEDTVVPEEPVAEAPVPVEPSSDVAIETPTQGDPETDAQVSGDPLQDIQAQIDVAIASAETALLESQIDDASAALESLATIDPDNERLPFLTAQLAQMQLRTYLLDARTAIRENRFEDAANELASARSLNLPDSAELDAAELELSAAENARQAEDALSLANARLEDGDLLEPANDNARYFFELALSRDPENTAARQGLSVIASKLAMQARTETDNGNFDTAEELLGQSNALDPDNSELAAAIDALANKREAMAEEQRQAEARRRAAAEKRAADERAAAERAAAARKAEAERAAAAAAAAAEKPVKEAATLSEDQPAATPPGPLAAGKESTARAESVENSAAGGVAVPAPGAPATQQKTATPVATQGPTPATVSELNRTKYVAPKYPKAAQRRNLSGWVDVIFTVDKAGLVKDIAVRDSEPGDTFVNAATRAVEKWEFEPVVEDGRAVEKRVGVRMMFALE